MAPSVARRSVSAFALHVADIEIQHRRVHELSYELIKALQTPTGRMRRVSNAFGSLVDYVRIHFADEEQFMESAGFPEADLREHAQVHADFLDTLIRAHQEVCEGKLPHSSAVELLVLDWLTVHELTHDRKYIGHFEQHL